MDSQAGHVMTIANSIIGVSLLAMPYCFKQCGIILSVLILILSNAISRLSCHLMLKSAVMARRRTFEFLAFHAFGPLGKFVTEIGLIGFLLGTCIAYFVVMGDLGPAIIAKMTNAKQTDTMRTSILMALALFCVLPLGLLRNIDSLNSVCTATIGFYFCLVLKIIAESAPHIFSGDWVSKVEMWRPAGILQCLPIFSMALSCQTQIFEVYQAIPTASLDKMNNLIRVAVNICTSVYIFVGIFGYIAFANQSFSGNILMSFSTSLLSDVMKIGFVLSLAFSFPLIIFPCRASLYSLLYKRTYSLHEGTDKYIPESRFKGLTFMIVSVSLVIGVMIPNIELVLGLVGSTIGIMVCVLFPATCFICISTKNTNERILAQIMLFVGVLIMVLGTYANLYAMEEITATPTVEKVTIAVPDILKLVEEDPALKVIDIPNTTKSPENWKPEKKEEPQNQNAAKEVRHEPPQPEEPAEPPGEVVKNVAKAEADRAEKGDQANVAVKADDKVKDSDLEKPANPLDNNSLSKKVAEIPELNKAPDQENPQLEHKLINDLQHGDAAVNDNKVGPADILPKLDVKSSVKPEVLINIDKQAKDHAKENEVDAKSNGKKGEEVDIEAIKKEDKELFEQEKEKLKEEEKKNMDLIKKMEKQSEDQKKLVEASKKLLEELKQKQKELEENKQQNELEKVKQEKLKAVEQIEEIAKKAIEKLSGGDQQNEGENAQPQDKADREAKGEQIEAVAKKAIEKLSGGDQQNENGKVQPGDNSNKRIDKVQLQDNSNKKTIDDQVNKNQNIVARQAESYVEDNANSNLRNLNTNNVDVKNDLASKQDYKIGLNKGNLVPLPIAMSNNFSGSYRNLVAARIGVPRDSVPNLETDDGKIKAAKIDQAKPRLDNEQADVKDLAQENVKKEREVNILDVLKTNAEKVTAANQDKQVKVIQHREIRSADDRDAFQAGVNREKLLEDARKKSEDSCDKDDKNVDAKQNEPADNKLSSTEIPFIRMITKLSEPELVSIKLPELDSSILKPLKRDLKSYKFRKRK